MPKIYVEYAGENAQPILVEMSKDDILSEGLELVADDSVNHRLVKAETTLRERLSGLRSITDSIIAPYRDHCMAPDELAVEFGIRIGLESGIVMAKASAEAAIQVKAVWRKAEKPGE